jgi:hypothetical protein
VQRITHPGGIAMVFAAASAIFGDVTKTLWCVIQHRQGFFLAGKEHCQERKKHKFFHGKLN